MQLTIYEDRERNVPLMQFMAGDDGSVTLHLREPMHQLHFLKEEVSMIKMFLENR